MEWFYDSMASLIVSYGSRAALLVASDLHAKIEHLLEDGRVVTDRE